MDKENKGSTPSAPTTPVNTNPEQKSQERTPSQTSPASDQPTSPPPPVKGLPASAMWLLVLVAAVVCGAGGFVLGQGSNQTGDKNGQQVPTPTVVQNKKKVTTRIKGVVKTDVHGLDYLVVDVSEFGAVKAKDHQTRYILEPQADAEYSYSFDELLPNVSYTILMQGCVERDQQSTCVLSRKVLSCSGRIPGGAVQQCLINGDGTADFLLEKSFAGGIVTPTGTPTPTPTPIPTNIPLP